MADHRYDMLLAHDGDYVVLMKLAPATAGDGYHWEEQTRWLIPGTQLED